jgi:hypothetical protein
LNLVTDETLQTEVLLTPQLGFTSM